MNITPETMTKRYLHKAGKASWEEVRMFYLDIADQYKQNGILPQCLGCGLRCVQHQVSPECPLTQFECPMSRAYNIK